MNFALNEVGLLDALKGMYVSAEDSTVTTRPLFFDDGFSSKDVNREIKRLGIFSNDDDVRSQPGKVVAFVPEAVLAFIGKTSKAKLILRTRSDGADYVVTAPSDFIQNSAGVFISIPLPTNNSSKFNAIDLSYVSSTKLISPTVTKVTSGTRVPLLAHVSSCTLLKRLSLQAKSKTVNKRIAAPIRNCVASYNVTPKETTVYSFTHKKLRYAKTITVKK
jgi:hypothetical protein